MTGNEYRKLIGRYVLSAYGNRGVSVYEEINLGTSIIGKQRRIDLFIVSKTGSALALECKYQDSSGTVDEKIPYALDDLEALRLPGAIVYAGAGFSDGVLHLLKSSEYAAYCFPEPESLQPIPRRSTDPIDAGTWQLDHILAVTFLWWDIVTAGKVAVTL